MWGDLYLRNNIEELRKTKNITQKELADILNVSRQTVNSIENGKYNPSIELAFKISLFFELPIEDIFIYEEVKKEWAKWNQFLLYR